jgi:hypothetical protein
LKRIAAEHKWPHDLVQRVAELQVPASALYSWSWYGLAPEKAAAQFTWHERLTIGDLRGRDATFADNEAFADLWADSPEEIGEWEITVERSPNSFAQFRLQENVHLPVLAIGPILVACCGFSRRNTIVGAKRISVRYGQALRVRRAFRRAGYGDQVRRLASPPTISRPEIGQYDLMRTQNFAVVNWWKKFVPNTFENVPEREGAVPGIPVSVMQYSAHALAPDAMIRPVRSEDLPRCVELINRTHAEMDLFRPYSAEYLESILNEGFWGERPRKTGNPAMDWWESTCGWNDFFVLEEHGRIRACAGLWDRGRDVRERWRRRGANEERIVAVAALLDFGFEDGAEECMERMIRDFIGRAHRLGRDYLAAPIEHLPTLAARMEKLNPEPDARSLRWGIRDPQIARPYVDLRYW